MVDRRSVHRVRGPHWGLATANRPGGTATITAKMGTLSAVAEISVKDQIAFLRAQQIWVVNEDGTGLERLTTEGVDMEPVWSPDGRMIAFLSTRESYFSIYVMNAEGTGVKRLAPPTDLASSPRWSPGGKWIAFIGAAGGIAKLHVVSAEGEEVINLTERRENESSPAWRPRPSKTPDPAARTIR